MTREPILDAIDPTPETTEATARAFAEAHPGTRYAEPILGLPGCVTPTRVPARAGPDQLFSNENKEA